MVDKAPETGTQTEDAKAIYQQFEALLKKHNFGMMVMVRTELGRIPLEKAAQLLRPEILSAILSSPENIIVELIRIEKNGSNP